MRASEFIDETIDISQHVKSHQRRQTDIRLEARTENGLAGYLDYSDWNGEIRINMIHVSQKRSGVGTALVKHLQKLYPATEIDWGMTTPEGTQLYNSLEFEEIPNSRVIKDLQKLDALKHKEEGYKKLAAEWESSSKTTEDRNRFLAATDDWNDLHDEIYQLEQELQGKKPYRRLIKV